MNILILLSFLPPFVYVVCAIIKEKHAVSFRSFFYIFALFFYSIAAFVQFFEPIEGYTVTPKTFIEINIILFFCYIVFDLIYFSGKNVSAYTEPPKLDHPMPRLKRQGVFVLLMFITLLGVYMLYSNGFSLRNLLFRGGDLDVERVQNVQSIGLIVNIFRISFSMVAFLFLCFHKSKYIKCLGVAFLLLFCAPTATARYFAAAAYIPVLLLIYPKFIYSRWLFKVAMCGGVLIVFPFLNIFRYVERGEFRPWEMFATLNFDSYISFAYVYEKEFVTYGYQLLGCIFFWIPRSMWEGKPIGSGYTIAEMDNLFDGFTNISMNYLGEGYINFGFLGIFLFVIVLAFVSKKMDYTFWNKYQGDYHNIFSVYYFYFLGMLIFIMRGDLMSSTAYTFGFLFVAFVIQKVVHFFILHCKENKQKTIAID